MIFVGVDLSINYPGICISHDFQSFEFAGIINDKSISNVAKNAIDDVTCMYDGVDVTCIAEKSHRSSIYHVSEREKLANAIRVSMAVIKRIRKSSNSEPVAIAMEGASFASKGSSFIDMCILSGVFRHMAAHDLLDYDLKLFYVFAPSELKNAIGAKGNARKDEILAAFMRDPILPGVAKTGFYKMLSDALPGGAHENSRVFNAEKSMLCSPFNDMIDAYLCVMQLWKVSSLFKNMPQNGLQGNRIQA